MNKIFFFFKNSWVVRAGLLVVISCVVYAPFLGNFFIWDDDIYLTKNLLLNDIDGLKRIWFDLRASVQYYPLVFTSFWVEHKFWALDPLGYHVDNVIIHCINAVLLWRILSFLGIKGSWLAAAIFAIHPIQAESVAWITERKNLLSGLFYFLSLYFFLHFYNPDKPLNFNENQNGKRPWLIYGVSLFFFLCALWSKTVTSTLPAVILLIHWWKQNCIRKKIFLMMIPYFTLSFSFAAITIQMEKVAGATGSEWDFSFLDRFLIAGRALWFYIGKLLWPNPIIFTYPRWIINDSIWWQYIYPVTFLFLIFLLWYLRKNIGRGPLTAILFFAGSLFPALGFFDVYPMRYSFVADHFQYLPCIGVIVIFASGIDKIAGSKRSKNYFILLALLLITLGNLTWNQGPVYKNSFSLWNDTIKKNPNAWMAHTNLGNILVRDNKIEEGIVYFRNAIKANPEFSLAHNNLGRALSDSGKPDEAAIHYRTAIRIKPDSAETHYDFANTLAKYNKFEEAIIHYSEAIKIQPYYADAHYNFAITLTQHNKFEEAIIHYRTAIRIKPDEQAHNNLGILLKNTGDLKNAIVHFRMAININPKFSLAYNNLGTALLGERKTSEAISNFKLAVNFKPDYAEAHYNLGTVLFRLGKIEDAIPYYRKAIKFSPVSAKAYNNLGAALLVNRELEEAVSNFKMAIELKPDFADAHHNLKMALDKAKIQSVR